MNIKLKAGLYTAGIFASVALFVLFIQFMMWLIPLAAWPYVFSAIAICSIFGYVYFFILENLRLEEKNEESKWGI